MKKKISKIVTLIILFLAILGVNHSFAMTRTVTSYRRSSRESYIILSKEPNIWCIEHGGQLWADNNDRDTNVSASWKKSYVKYINSNRTEQQYKADDLNGEWDTSASSTSLYVKKYQIDSGSPSKNWSNLLNSSGRIITKGIDETETIAYIAGRTRVNSSTDDYNYPSINQIVLWNTELAKSHKSFSYNDWYNDSSCDDKNSDKQKIQSLEAEIEAYKEYIKKLNSYTGPSIEKENITETVSGSYTLLGPLNIKFLQEKNTATNFAGIGTIYAVGDIKYPNTGNQMYNVNHNDENAIKVLDASGREIDRSKWDLVDSSGNNITELQSGTDFYVKILTTERSNAAKITFDFYTSKIVIKRAIQAQPTLYKDGKDKGTGQYLLEIDVEVEYKPYHLEIELSKSAEPVDYTLTLNKKDYSTNASLSGSRFTITGTNYNKTINGNESVTFTFSAEGTYRYTIRETTIPTHYNGVTDITLTIEVGESADKKCYIRNVTVAHNNSQDMVSLNHSGNRGTLEIKNKKQPAGEATYTLNITKKAGDTGGILSGAEFTITKGNATAMNYATLSSTKITGNSSVVFTLKQTGTYQFVITETTVPDGYVACSPIILNIVVAYNASTNGYYVTNVSSNTVEGVQLNGGTLEVTDSKIHPTEYPLILRKVEEGTTIGLAGAIFEIKQGNTVIGNVTSGSNGTVEVKFAITGVGTYTYTITETKAPDEYILDSTPITVTITTRINADGTQYEVNSISVSGRSGISLNTSTKTLTIPNKPATLDISGLVWLDEIHIADKEGMYNGRVDPDEAQRFSGVEVNLYEGNTLVQTTRTNANGEYTFSKVRGYRNYRITFTYEGMTYTSTIFDSNTTNGERTSKADETEAVRKAFNSKFREIIPGKATGSNGEINLDYNITPGSDTRYAVAEVNTNNPAFNIQAETPEFATTGGVNITNINLGLVTRDKADFSMQQGVKEMTVTINGVTTKITEGITDINTEDEIREYLVQRNQTREYNIKNSDYTYRIGDYTDLSGSNKKVGANQTEELEIYITYMVAIKNGGDVDGVVNEVKNYYQDTYTITQINDRADGTGNNLAYQDGGSSNGYKIANIDTSILGTIEQGRSKWIYITYRINKNNQTERNIELGNKTTVIEIERYTTYRDNSSADYEKYSNGVLDANSAPGNLNITADVSTHENDTAKAPTLNITKGEKRTITGNVWDDLNQDGYKNDGTASINGVTVQLVEIYNGREFIWKEMYTGEQNISYVDYIGSINRDQTNVKSIEDGEYYFEDFIPGEYIIRFRYGDTVKTVKLQSDGGANEKSYNGHAYESTVFGYDSKAQDRSDRRNEVLNNTKTVNNKIGSLLVAPYNNPSDEKIAELIDLTWMAADTDSIRVDSETENIDNIQLGLKERKKDNITVEKGISHINVTLNNGTEYANTNYPLEGGVSGIFDTPNGPWIQMSSEIINGATLKIKYKIKVTNNSDDNTITNLKFIDYLPEGMRIDYGTNTEWEGVDTSKLSNILDQSIVSSAQSSNKVMITNKNGITLNPNESKELEIEASVTLSPDMREYNYINLAEIIEYTSEAGRRNEEGVPGNQDPTPDETGEIETPEKDADTSEEVTITQNTGENKAPMYYFIGIGIAIVLLGGIGLIKKYVV